MCVLSKKSYATFTTLPKVKKYIYVWRANSVLTRAKSIFSFPKEQTESPDHFAVGFVKKDPLVISQSQISYPPPPQKSTGQIE